MSRMSRLSRRPENGTELGNRGLNNPQHASTSALEKSCAPTWRAAAQLGSRQAVEALTFSATANLADEMMVSAMAGPKGR